VIEQRAMVLEGRHPGVLLARSGECLGIRVAQGDQFGTVDGPDRLAMSDRDVSTTDNSGPDHGFSSRECARPS
jgi:hypothetical protein